MVATEISHGEWYELKERLKNRWHQLTEEDFASIDGSIEHLAGVIQQKTGEARDFIERIVREYLQQARSGFDHAGEATRDYAARAAESAQEVYERVADNVRTGYREAEGLVRQRPIESVVVAFGTGIITGLIIGLIARNR
jgi:ElaB/YqjD/DUF883 family membrane-anchored ribosome-binding protein